MTQRAQFETNLLFFDSKAPNFSDVATSIALGFSSHQFRVRPKYQSKTDLVFAIGDLTLTIAHSASPLDLAAFMHAKTPNTQFGLPKQTQRDLTSHRQAFIVRVTGPVDAHSEKAKLAVCYVATRQLIKHTHPDLIHWKKSDTVYTMTQFCNRTGESVNAFHGQVPHCPSPFAGKSYAPQNTADDALSRKEHMAKDQALEKLRLATLRNQAFPASGMYDVESPLPSKTQKTVLMHGIAVLGPLIAGVGTFAQLCLDTLGLS